MSFPVPIKGVRLETGCVVLLENECSEWELPGGRLEAGEDPAICLASGKQLPLVLDNCEHVIAHDALDGLTSRTRREPVRSLSSRPFPAV